MKPTRLAKSRNTARMTVTPGVKSSRPKDPIPSNPRKEKVTVSRKMLRIHWVDRARRKYETVRGEYWLDPNCSRSRTNEKTKPVKVTMLLPTAASSESAWDAETTGTQSGPARLTTASSSTELSV